MKNTFFLFLAALIAFSSCKEFTPASHMQEMSDMKDSIFKTYPTVAAVTINVKNNDLLIITLGSKDLFTVTESKRSEMASSLGAMALRIFGPESGLSSGKLIITPNERNEVAEPADGVSTTVSLDGLKKGM